LDHRLPVLLLELAAHHVVPHGRRVVPAQAEGLQRRVEVHVSGGQAHAGSSFCSAGGGSGVSATGMAADTISRSPGAGPSAPGAGGTATFRYASRAASLFASRARALSTSVSSVPASWRAGP